ncbi:MAG TPA: DUF4160 domain-containing protein [Planctomycetota bacterium]|nr:DUF4160 domain-containing protein [Planctomycetota bacterium]
MPEISRFFGIVIRMYHSDHAPPHFHASYGSANAKFEIATGRIRSGTLPPRERRKVLRWLAFHRAELTANWRRAEENLPLNAIDPLE